MTEDAERTGRSRVVVVGDREYDIQYSDEEQGDMDDEEQTWIDLFRFMADTARDLGEAVDDHPWEGVIPPASNIEEYEYRMKVAVGMTDNLERPSLIVVDLYEDDLHSEQAIAVAVWDDEDNIEMWELHPEPSMRVTQRIFSLKDMAVEAKKLIGATIRENAEEDTRIESGFTAGDQFFPLFSPLPDVKH